MHERALMDDVVRKIEQTARAGGCDRVTGVVVRLGALSDVSLEHFREHFLDATRGTLAEGAAVDATLDENINAPYANDVILESIEVETGAQPRL